MEKTFLAWYQSQSFSFKMKCVFMHNNAPFHISKLTCEFLEHERFAGEKIMEWPPPSPDLNSIKNLWSILKRKLCGSNKQYINKANLWKTIKIAMSEIEQAELKKFYQNQCIIDYRLLLRERVSILKCIGFKDLWVYLFYYWYWSSFNDFINFLLKCLVWFSCLGFMVYQSL